MKILNVTREEKRAYKRIKEYSEARHEPNEVLFWMLNTLGEEAIDAARQGATMLERRALHIGIAPPRVEDLTDAELEQILLKEFGDGQDETVYEEQEQPPPGATAEGEASA